MQELIGATYTAQEAERRRIALDLHDSIAQEISACLMIARRLGENGEGNRAALVASLKTTIDEVRRISWEMRPPELERLGFRGAVIGFLDDFTARCGLALDMTDSDWNASGLSDEAATHIYRIIQESFANIAKHAAATTLRIAISQGESRLSIAIEDDGRGFDAKVLDAPGSKLSHLGIGGMRERTRLIKGTLEILSVPGRGTTIRLEVPCAG
jgi:signal transduction histidine kinase